MARFDPVSRAQEFQSTQAALAALGTARQGPPVSESCNKKVLLSVMSLFPPVDWCGRKF